MKLFLPLLGHANKVSLPLRTGCFIVENKQQYVELIDYKLDADGTENQRKTEREAGREHYIGRLVIQACADTQDGPKEHVCRVVVQKNSDLQKLPTVVTVLPIEKAVGDITVTKHLDGMLKRGKINIHDLSEIYHARYLEGKINNSNDCEDIFEKEIRGRIKMPASNDPTANAVLEHSEEVSSAIDSLCNETPTAEAPPKFETLSIPTAKYKYKLAEAYVENVRIEDDKIKLTTINSYGKKQELSSFKLSTRPHLSSLHSYAFDYLKSREGDRAIFAICVSPEVLGVLAESVTAICLQISKVSSKEKVQVLPVLQPKPKSQLLQVSSGKIYTTKEIIKPSPHKRIYLSYQVASLFQGRSDFDPIYIIEIFDRLGVKNAISSLDFANDSFRLVNGYIGYVAAERISTSFGVNETRTCLENLRGYLLSGKTQFEKSDLLENLSAQRDALQADFGIYKVPTIMSMTLNSTLHACRFDARSAAGAAAYVSVERRILDFAQSNDRTQQEVRMEREGLKNKWTEEFYLDIANEVRSACDVPLENFQNFLEARLS